jgi:hypothetical protein
MRGSKNDIVFVGQYSGSRVGFVLHLFCRFAKEDLRILYCATVSPKGYKKRPGKNRAFFIRSFAINEPE